MASGRRLISFLTAATLALVLGLGAARCVVAAPDSSDSSVAPLPDSSGPLPAATDLGRLMEDGNQIPGVHIEMPSTPQATGDDFLDVEFVDASVRDVLEMLARYSGKNIIIADSVTGTIHYMAQNRVTGDQVFDAILVSQHLRHREHSGTLIVEGPGDTWAGANLASGSLGQSGNSSYELPTPVSASHLLGTASVTSASAELLPPRKAAAGGGAPASTAETKYDVIFVKNVDVRQIVGLWGGYAVNPTTPGLSSQFPTPQGLGPTTSISPDIREQLRPGLGGMTPTGVASMASLGQGAGYGQYGLGGIGGIGGIGGGIGGFGGGIGGYGGGMGGYGGGMGGYGGGYGGYGGGMGGYGGGIGRGIGGGYGGGIFTLPEGLASAPIGIIEQNAIVVRGTPEAIDELREVIAMLDKPVKQVAIRIEIVSVNLTRQKELGISWTLEGTDIYVDGPRTALGGNLNVGYVSNNFRAQVAALQNESRAEIVNAPIIVAQNGQYASVQVAESVPSLVSTVVIDEGGGRNVVTEAGPTYSIGTVLTVFPRINADDSVTLLLTPTLSVPSGEVRSPDGTVVIPRVAQRSLVTTVRVADRRTVVLGGLVNRNDTITESRVPVLSEIPIIGRLFRSKTRFRDDTELLFFVTPMVLHEPEQDERL